MKRKDFFLFLAEFSIKVVKGLKGLSDVVSEV
jgi:hypothetical protein